jgi:Mg/Co/Ni transporter MgtE
MIALSVAVLVFCRVMLTPSGHEAVPAHLWMGKIAIMISLALAIQIIWATVLGSMIPLLANRFRIDPAVVSSPAIATLVDIGGIAIYFTMAKLMLGI